ncbi:GGDEF domain-containing protein [Actinotalea sp. C106]|uniref:GGDEF domain-containing protein n=1 Tax=Actinotalea sp. C106 TaxID=2908644 RepID=UPI0020279281|nr:GGDEF domain-containing protein [Actinotalea sp. C106]
MRVDLPVMPLNAPLIAPRDRAATARTLLTVTTIAFVVTVGWEVHALALGRETTTPGTALGATAVAALLLAGALACWRRPERVPPAGYAAIPALGVVMVAGIGLVNQDATAAGQYGYVYPVVLAAAHFRRGFAWAVTGTSVLCAAVVALAVLPRQDAVSDAVLVGAGLVTMTQVLVTLVGYQERLVARLNALATADPLTGLATRRELEEVAERALAAPRHGERRTHPEQAVGLMLIDVDHFKTINDTHGHPVGDAVLVHVADRVRAVVRAEDTVARLGGDELAVLTTGEPAAVTARARRVHASIREHPYQHGGEPLGLTASVGVADTPRGHLTWTELYAAADAALYRAKVAGRDTVLQAGAGPTP